jgi:NAD(P)-dependent dehydrogenase (short-subunit alcohol dehydrogenase family)
VVTVSSNAHRYGEINLDDLQSGHHYRRDAGYGQYKLANLMFSCELQRRPQAAGSPAIAVAAHPGLTRTDLARYLSRVMTAFYVLFERPARAARRDGRARHATGRDRPGRARR